MICLTFDTDWLSDADMARFVAQFPIPGRATFFCHQPFPSLATTRHERCPHPFISDLSDWQGALDALRLQVNPQSRGVRTHSCVFSHMVGLSLHQMGFEYVSQANNMFDAGLRPFRHPWGVWELPIYYMDNMDFWMTSNWPDLQHSTFSRRVIETALHSDGLYVFDFHPIHIALNTRTPEDYQRVKPGIVSSGASPFDFVFDGRGTRTFFEELCAEMVSAGVVSYGCSDAIDMCAAPRSEPTS
jgi:hypothetical protein